MRFSTATLRFRLFSGLLACCLVTPAMAQQDGADRSRGDQQRSAERESQDEAPQQRSSDRQQQDRQQRSAEVRLDPQGWVRMGVDYDGDGRYDAIETIYVYDLEMARQRSRQRQQSSRERTERDDQRTEHDDQRTEHDDQRTEHDDQRTARGQQRAEREDRPMARGRSSDQQARRTYQVRGTIGDLRRINMHDGDGRYVVARVRTQEGRTAKVLLGREEQLSRLDLGDGDRVQVRGRVARVNDQPILLATRVSSGDQQVRVEPKRVSRPLKQVRGEILRTRTARFRGHDDPFVIAEMRTADGQRQLVNLGPKSKLGEVDFSQTDEVRLLATRGRINGRSALVAEQINVDGRTIKVQPDQRRDSRWSSGQDLSDLRRDGDRQPQDRRAQQRLERHREVQQRQDRDRERQDRDRQDRDRQDRDPSER